jgi:proline-specific peptidase
MITRVPVVEGRIPFKGYTTWYRIAGDSEAPGKLPLLCLHGGPGAPSDHLEPLEAMIATGRRVITYDQLGCGKSDQPDKPDMWTVELYVEEVGVVCEALGLNRVHILGHSWGGMLGMEYALTQPDRLASLIVSSSPASVPEYLVEANRLRSELPPVVLAALLKHEATGTTSEKEYRDAAQVFDNRHLYRLSPWPDYMKRASARIGQVYQVMWGPSESHSTGVLKDWDITDRLGEISVPTLIMSGRYDEVTPSVVQTVYNGIPGSEWVLFEHSAHTSYGEEPERYMQVLDDFLIRVETSQR